MASEQRKREIKPTLGVPERRPSPNDALDLSEFDYNNLIGKFFEKYQELERNLHVRDLYDFEQYQAYGDFEVEFDRKTGRQYDKLVGILLHNSTPINVTRIPLLMAQEMNRQIFAKDNPRTNSRYFLLKDTNKR